MQKLPVYLAVSPLFSMRRYKKTIGRDQSSLMMQEGTIGLKAKLDCINSVCEAYDRTASRLKGLKASQIWLRPPTHLVVS